MNNDLPEFAPVPFGRLDESDVYRKGHRPYFAQLSEAPETRKRDSRAVFLSEVEKNVDDAPSQSSVQVIRATVPIYGVDAEFFGIVIINMDLDEALKDLIRSRHLVYLTNDRGQFLVHPDKNKVQIPEEAPGVEKAPEIDPNDPCLIQNNEDFALVKAFYQDKYRAEHVLTYSGRKVRALEYRGLSFP